MKNNWVIFLLVAAAIACNVHNDKAVPVQSGVVYQKAIGTKEDQLPYFDSMNMSKSGSIGYQDTFSLDHTRFRVLHHDTLYDGTVQKLEPRGWTDVLRFEQLGNHNNYYINKDLNADGFNDLCLEWKWDMDVFFYDPAQRSFRSKPLRLSYDWHLLNREKRLYCNYQQTKTAAAVSELYTIQNFDKVVWAHIEFKPMASDAQLLDKVLLFKGKTMVGNVKINKDADFDYVKWWSVHYQKLL